MMEQNVIFLWRCSFCGKTSKQAEYIISVGQPMDPAICDECIVACQEIVDLKRKEAEPDKDINTSP